MKQILLLCSLLATATYAQDRIARGAITYISGDAVYTSLGREAGVRDSSLLTVRSEGDSVGLLKVFAVSSKSSACSVVRARRRLRIGDEVIGSAPPESVQPVVAARPDSAGPQPPGVHPEVKSPPRPFPVTVRGRVSAEYFLIRNSNPSQESVRPGIVLNLRGNIQGSPLSFEFFGNLRSIAYGTASPLVHSAANQSRIYSFSVTYDDSLFRVSLGRLVPAQMPSAGYIDGAVLTRTFGNFVLGTAAGYEPGFSQRAFSGDRRKFAVFAGYATDGPARVAASAGYARTYFSSALDREAVSASFEAALLPRLSLWAQSEVDLRTASNQSLTFRPSLTSLFATMTYRVTDALTLGLGTNVLRPAYSFAAVSGLPDSLFDKTLRTSANLSVNLYLPAGISLSNFYSPRSSGDGFGKEYLNTTMLGLSNVLNQGVQLRGNVNVSSSPQSLTRSYGGSVQKSFSRLISLSVRYQVYRYEISQLGEIQKSRLLGLDAVLSLLETVSLWAIFERTSGTNSDGYSVLAEITWRF